MAKFHIEAWTDGACKGNPGPGGWAYKLICNERTKVESGGEKDTTNNRMEIKAAIQALKAVTLPHKCTININTDSMIVCNAINSWLANWEKNGWRKSDKKPVENADLWKELAALIKTFVDVKATKVKAHSGIEHNEEVDKLASTAAENI